jgi:peptide-methionine (S)-S-oxide reductase
MNNNTEIAIFGGGCFWCTEAIFLKLRGVLSVTPGYAGGTVKNPNYYEVSSGTTGHAEVIKIEFDPSVISYDNLLDVFWHVHNPTSLNRQGADVGTEYRSIILYTTEAQKKTIEESKKKLEESKEFEQPIVTEIQKLDTFYDAESYHNNYFERNKDQPYCQLVIAPKIKHFLEKYGNMT